MTNSLLDSLPALHGTMLSIIVGFVTAFALYAYQTTSSARQQLDNIKRQVQNISSPSFEISINRANYLNSDGELDWQCFKDGLRDASSLFSHIDHEDHDLKRETIIVDDMQNDSDASSRFDYIKKHGFKKDAVYIEKTQIEKAARQTLGLLSLAMTSYPYFGHGMLNKPATDELSNYRLWLPDLSRYNGFLLWLWNGHHRGLSELMNQYRLLDIQRQEDMHEKSLQQMLKSNKDQGISMSDEQIQRIKRQFHTIRETDYSLILRDFFLKVTHLEQQVIPKANEHLITLTTYENSFKLKTRTIWVLASAVFIFILGIMTPMVITAYSKPPIVKSLEICLFVFTTVPYLVGLLYLIAVVSRLNQP